MKLILPCPVRGAKHKGQRRGTLGWFPSGRTSRAVAIGRLEPALIHSLSGLSVNESQREGDYLLGKIVAIC